MHPAEVSVIRDSINKYGNRITTFQTRYWRGIHSELMTHRNLSKSAGSSRARPSAKIIQQVRNDPWGPLEWGKNEPGMRASQQLDAEQIEYAMDKWRIAAYSAADNAQNLLDLNLHKQVVNRVLEPFTYIDVVITGTDFNNFFALRDHEAADPTIRDLAVKMKAAREASTPTLLKSGEWHLPYITDDDWIVAEGHLRETGDQHPTKEAILALIIMISVARCARTSYRAFDGNVASIVDDRALYEKLIVSTPMHATPAEHQAMADVRLGADYWAHRNEHGNFTGWRQHRKMLANEYVPG